jgi:superfamily II DNA or RNA helicase/TRAP-type C4-dicarboxylate transport system substrate-binding protein
MSLFVTWYLGSESSRKQFSYRLLVATTDGLGSTARRTIDAQEKPVHLVLLTDLLDAAVSWPASVANLRSSPKPKPAKPRDYQKDAIRDVVKGFTKSDRGQLIMACGTGKTLTSLFIHEKLDARRTLILVPSLSLLKQTMKVWRTNAKTEFEALPVCSDETVGKDPDAVVSSTSEIGVPVTTDPAEIATFLRKRGHRVVFSTYQSSPRVAAALAQGRVSGFDLVIADEAHRVAGPVSSEFGTVLDAKAIKEKRRLFMTATPRYFTGRVLKTAQDADLEVASMDDETRFGAVFHRLSFGEAIKRDLLTDYQVVVVGVDDATYREYAEKGTRVRLDEKMKTDARTLAGQVGLAKAIRKYDMRRMISFHSRVSRAREFAAEIPDVIAWMPARQRPKGALWSDYASGEMTAGERHVRLRHLSNLDDGKCGLLANARCLAEGVDVPTLDGVAFIDPRRSEVDIVQAVGRAIRLADDKAIGTIVIPVFIDTNADPEKALDDSVFKPVWDVIKALRAHDDDLAEQIDSLRREMGRHGGVARLPDKIRLDVPVKVGREFAEAFDVRLVEQTTASWGFWFGLLLKYVEENGTARVLQAETFNGHKLGLWVGVQRYKWDSLTEERRQLLSALPGWTLDTRADQWDEGFQHLQEYVADVGDARVRDDYVADDGYRLGKWVGKQRTKWESLSEDRRQRLLSLPGWTLGARDSRWEELFRHLQQYVEKNGDAQVPQSYKIGRYWLGKWVSVQRRTWDSLSEERRQRLLQLPGWTLDARGEWWEDWFRRLEEYVADNGNARVPQKYVTVDGFNLGTWVGNQKSTWKTISEERRRRLRSLSGWTLDARAAFWENGFRHLKQFAEENGHTQVPSKYVVDGFRLGGWINTQRINWLKLDKERQELLQQLPGWTTNTRTSQWEEGFGHLVAYTEENGTAQVPTYCVFNGFKLGQWVGVQRSGWNSVSDDRKRRLKQLPGWAASARAAWWEEGFRQLQQYAKENGHACPPQSYKTADGVRLGSWVATQRQAMMQAKLSPERQKRLEKLPGWQWAPRGGV